MSDLLEDKNKIISQLKMKKNQLCKYSNRQNLRRMTGRLKVHSRHFSETSLDRRKKNLERLSTQ
jgi:hypothetical protein